MKVSFCAQCGNKLPDNASFCPFCGTKVDRSTEDDNEAPNIQEPVITETVTSKADEVREPESIIIEEDNESIVQDTEEIEELILKNKPIDSHILKEETVADDLANMLFDEYNSAHTPKPENVTANVKANDVKKASVKEYTKSPQPAPAKPSATSAPKAKNYGWIWAVIIVAIVAGLKAYSSYLERENERMAKDLIERFGGVDNALKAIEGGSSKSTAVASESFSNTYFTTKYPIGWHVNKDESFDTGCEVTIGSDKDAPAKFVMITVMDKDSDYSVKQYLGAATAAYKTDPSYQPCELEEIASTTFYGKTAYYIRGYFQKHSDWQQNIKYIAYQENSKVVILFFSNLTEDDFSTSDFEVISKNLTLLQ